MATRVIDGMGGFRLSRALVALALTVAVVVLAIQASSVWSTRTGSKAEPKPTHIAVSAKPFERKGVQIPLGCRPKYGCEDSATRVGRNG